MAGGRTLRGTVEGDADPPRLISRMLEWMPAGPLPVARLVPRYAFAHIHVAADDMLAARVIEPVLEIQT
jgi:aryl-alcohol dehydrogenase